MEKSDPLPDLSPEQCRAARAILDWSQEDLAGRAGITRKPLADFEAGKTTPYARTRAHLRAVLEEAGVTFVSDGQYSGVDGLGARVRLPVVDGWTISLAGRWMAKSSPAVRIALTPGEGNGYALSAAVPTGGENLSRSAAEAASQSAHKALQKLLRRGKSRP